MLHRILFHKAVLMDILYIFLSDTAQKKYILLSLLLL